MENSGEGILLFMKIRPFIERARTDSPSAFQHIEWAANQTDMGRQRAAFFEQRFGEKLAGVKVVE